MAMAACYPSSYYAPPREARPQPYLKARVPPQDYSVPLHVDCSVEYELPDCAKPPQGVKVEPLLMIHPCHFRNLERQRRRPFENNLPSKAARCCDYGDCSGTSTNTATTAATQDYPKYRGAVRNHPYALPCAPRPQEVTYPLQQHHHQPTLIYNV